MTRQGQKQPQPCIRKLFFPLKESFIETWDFLLRQYCSLGTLLQGTRQVLNPASHAPRLSGWAYRAASPTSTEGSQTPRWCSRGSGGRAETPSALSVQLEFLFFSWV